MQTTTLALRIDVRVYNRADALRDRMREDTRLATQLGKIERADVLRIALDEGLAILEERYGVSPEGSPPERDVE